VRVNQGYELLEADLIEESLLSWCFVKCLSRLRHCSRRLLLHHYIGKNFASSRASTLTSSTADITTRILLRLLLFITKSFLLEKMA